MTRLQAPWLDDPATTAVTTMLTAAGHQALFVGGCVRDALLGRGRADIDVATDARPETVMALAAAAGLKPVPTGLDHGTVTVVSSRHPYEVTTFRRDVATDGRRAVVAYSRDMADDAARRDFTMNALYARPDGTVLDPTGRGLADLAARRVCFVGDPGRRIAEDYLRVLRLFRFHAWYGDPERGLDPAALAACAAAASGLDRLSRERVGAETARLLAAPDPAPAVAAMAGAGILARVLPGADPSLLAPLVALERRGGHAPRWIRRLAALGADPAWPELLRLSKAGTKALAAVAAARGATAPAAARGATAPGDARPAASPAALAYRFGADAARDAVLLDAAAARRPAPADLEAELARGAAARFPLRAADLPHRQGPALGEALRRLEAAWIAADFGLDRAALLALDRRGDLPA